MRRISVISARSDYFASLLRSMSVLPCSYMSKEDVPLQHDMFSGELVDARSDYQKKKDRERSAPNQLLMFRTPDMVQFGGRTHSAFRDWLDQATAPALVLEVQDTRTPEEIERDLLREAQKQMKPLFGGEEVERQPETTEQHVPDNTPLPRYGIIFDSENSTRPVGLRARLRAQSVPVRSRRRVA